LIVLINYDENGSLIYVIWTNIVCEKATLAATDEKLNDNVSDAIILQFATTMPGVREIQVGGLE